jgi:hypothetical protein
VHWKRDSAPLAEKFLSLGLSRRADGAVWLTGLSHQGKHSWWEVHVSGPQVVGYVLEGDRWVEESWSVDDPEAPAFIDPQWMGDELWYVAVEGDFGDPVDSRTPNRIRSWTADGGAVDRYADKSLADPSPVMFGGALHVFVTQYPRGILHLSGTPLRVVGRMGGFTVPFATVVGEDELWLIAQGNTGGLRQPMKTVSRDGQRWSEWQPMVPRDSVGDCTSPVVLPPSSSTDEWMLLCVEEARR